METMFPENTYIQTAATATNGVIMPHMNGHGLHNHHHHLHYSNNKQHHYNMQHNQNGTANEAPSPPLVDQNEFKPEPPISATEAPPQPEVDIIINNVVCSFSVRCHLNLRQIALNGVNVEYRRENGMVTMKLRKPYTTASIWSSGKITCTGATSEDQSKIAARRYARCLQKLGFKTRFTNFRVVNVLGTCSMPFAIKITLFSEKYREAEYEPELHPGVTYRLKKPKATLKIFSTGGITVTAPSVADVQSAIEHIYPLVYEFRKEKTKEDILLAEKRLKAKKRKLGKNYEPVDGPDEDDVKEEDESEEEVVLGHDDLSSDEENDYA